MKTEVSTYFNEEAPSMLKAVVFKDDSGYGIHYYKSDTIFNEERFPGKSIHYVEDAAENWALGLKKL
jgi:hypothetical protein